MSGDSKITCPEGHTHPFEAFDNIGEQWYCPECGKKTEVPNDAHW